ncbi:hypothetical protein yinte0001_26680 [Yersinia intermedia ATCC 29909]|nr:hypothetical protein yinte0001_26680 [Yersinia intermedia ATCC 29909]
MPTTQAATLNRLSLSESHTKHRNPPSLPAHRNPLIKLNCAEMEQSANSLILAQTCRAGSGANLLILSRNAQSVCREIKGEQCSGSAENYRYSGSSEYKHCLGSVVIRNGCNNENQQVTGKEKGGTENTALCGYGFFHHEENQHVAAWHVRTCETFVGHRVTVSKPVQPSGASLAFLRCSPLSLRPQASSTHAEKLTVGLSSFSRSTLASIWSISSWGKRIPFVADLLFFALVAIKRSPLSVMTPYTNLERKKRVDVPQHLALMCPNTLLTHGVKKATPQSATNTAEASNHNVNEAYTMALQHSTQTRPKFQYLFLAVCRSDLNAKPHRESVTAHSEQDARRSLAGQFILSFAGRIPAQGVCNA